MLECNANVPISARSRTPTHAPVQINANAKHGLWTFGWAAPTKWTLCGIWFRRLTVGEEPRHND